MKDFYADVYVTKKMRERVSFSADKKPSKKEMFEILDNGEIDDISDTEDLDYISVDKIVFHDESDSDEESDEESDDGDD